MKRILFLLLMLTISVGSFAQTHYRVTGDNVNVRTGPGTNYSRVTWSGAYGTRDDQPYQLSKGEIVCSKGATKNGFVPIWGDAVWMSEETGWVSSKYLTPATKCSVCKGKGNTGQVCPECDGAGMRMCCGWTGYVSCSKCKGHGYY